MHIPRRLVWVFGIAAAVVTLWGCSPSVFRYERPYPEVLTQAPRVDEATHAGPSAVVPPIDFPQLERLDQWQVKVEEQMRSELVSSLQRTGVFGSVQAVDSAEGACSQGTVVFQVSMSDTLLHSPYYYVFVSGEKEWYTLRADIAAVHNDDTIATYRFARDTVQIQGMWFTDLFVPIFPVVIRKEGRTARQMMTAFLSSVRDFVTAHAERFRTTVRSGPISTADAAPGAEAQTSPAAVGVPSSPIIDKASLSWQRFRKPDALMHSLSGGIGYALDRGMSLSDTVYPAGGGYTIRESSESGLLLPLGYAFRPSALADIIRHRGGINATSYRTVYSEIFIMMHYAKLYRSVRTDYYPHPDADTDSTYTNEESGGHTFVQFFFGPRLCIRPSKHTVLFGHLGLGFSIENAEHIFDSEDPVQYEPDETRGCLMIGGGLRFGAPSSRLQFEPFFANITYALAGTSSDDYRIVTLGAKARVNLGP